MKTNSLVGDHPVAIVYVDEAVLKGSDMSDGSMNVLYVKSHFYDHQVAVGDLVNEGDLDGCDMSWTLLNGFLVKT